MAIVRRSIPYRKIRPLPTLLQRYADREPDLLPFIPAFPELGEIKKILEAKRKTFSAAQRQWLVQVLESQTGNGATDLQRQNLQKLKESETYTVSCGHQLSLAGGPVYMAYKILTVIKLAEELNQAFPQHYFVPVHWLASEDHDLDEIKSVSFFGQKIDFDIQQTGAVGRMKTNDLARQMRAIRDFPEWMASAYDGDTTLAQATRAWLQTAFGKRGLLVLDADDATLKRAFLDHSLMEIETPWIEKRVTETTSRLENHHVKAQIHVRPINLFYLTDKERLRLEEVNGKIKTIDGGYEWEKPEARVHFGEHPEKLSPNVAFRPLYSQIVLPDVAFIGGPAEISYWLQLHGVFEEAGVPMPLLIPRFTAAYIGSGLAKKMDKLGLAAEDLLKEDYELRKEASGMDIEIPLPDLEVVYQSLLELAGQVDPTLVPMAKGELVKAEKIAGSIMKRIAKASEQKNEQRISQVLNLVRKIFPEGGLQERSESWLSFLANDPAWLDKIYNEVRPMEMAFCILIDRE